MPRQNLLLYEDRYAIHVNQEGDSLFYFFDYDTRNADVNMQFQHFHSFYEICVMLCPSSKHFWEGQPYVLQALDIVVIPPNVLHKTMYPVGDPCQRLIIRFNLPAASAGVAHEFQQLMDEFSHGPCIYRFEPEVQKIVFRKINDIFLLGKEATPMRSLRIHTCFVEFLTLLYLNRERSTYANNPEITGADEKIYAVAVYIHSHYTEDLSLDFLSQQFYLSSYYLSRQFKRVTGFTLTDYLQMTRIRNIQALLINTDIPITEAAGMCGFFSFSQFNRTFRKHIGMSPSQYRRQHRLAASEMG